MGQAQIAQTAGVLAHEADAMPPGFKQIHRRSRFRARFIGQRVEGRSLVLNREHEVDSAFRCEFDEDGVAALSAVAVANDVRQCFFKAQVNREQRVGRDREFSPRASTQGQSLSSSSSWLCKISRGAGLGVSSASMVAAGELDSVIIAMQRLRRLDRGKWGEGNRCRSS